MDEQHECKKGAPDWMVTFADMMTLLMCFFVLLLSFSTMEMAKFKVVAGFMREAFGVQREHNYTAIPSGQLIVTAGSAESSYEKISLMEKVKVVLQEMEIEATLQETPETGEDVRKAEDEILEYKVRELTYLDKVDHHWPLDTEGLLVVDVVNGGWANIAGLLADDLLLEIQGEPIKKIRDFKTLTKRLAKKKPKQVVLFVRRERATRFVFIEPDWPQD